MNASENYDKMQQDNLATSSENPAGIPLQKSTTSFLTATTLVYAIGAGITAAAGTRLALQLVVAQMFVFYSSQ